MVEIPRAPSLDELIRASELQELEQHWGTGQRWHVVVEMGANNFQYWWRKIVDKANRRGEVVFAIQRPNGHVLVHSKSIYPARLYRLPSGGIHPQEAVLDGLRREATEETGLALTSEAYLGMVTYEFRHRGRSLFFVSYVFLAQADFSVPLPQDTTETICDLHYVSLTELKEIAATLRELPAGWADWGEFRAPPHDMVIEALESKTVCAG